MSRDLLGYLDVSGPLYAWLGHFRSTKCLDEGHNTDDADAADKMYEQMAGGRLNSKASDEPGGA
jgi:hypothetical protein